MSQRFAIHHPGGMHDNSPTFQRWDLNRQWVKVPKGRLKRCTKSAVPSGLIARRTAVPNVETLGYYRRSLRDKEEIRASLRRLLQGSGAELLFPSAWGLSGCAEAIELL